MLPTDPTTCATQHAQARSVALTTLVLPLWRALNTAAADLECLKGQAVSNGSSLLWSQASKEGHALQGLLVLSSLLHGGHHNDGSEGGPIHHPHHPSSLSLHVTCLPLSSFSQAATSTQLCMLFILHWTWHRCIAICAVHMLLSHINMKPSLHGKDRTAPGTDHTRQGLKVKGAAATAIHHRGSNF